MFSGILTFLGVLVFLIAGLCPLNFFLSGLSVLKRFISERSKQDHKRSGQQGSFLGHPARALQSVVLGSSSGSPCLAPLRSAISWKAMPELHTSQAEFCS